MQCIRTSCIFHAQWLPQRQVVRPDLPPRKAMEAGPRDGLWSVRRRNVSGVPVPFDPSRCATIFKKNEKQIEFFFLFLFSLFLHLIN